MRLGLRLTQAKLGCKALRFASHRPQGGAVGFLRDDRWAAELRTEPLSFLSASGATPAPGSVY